MGCDSLEIVKRQPLGSETLKFGQNLMHRVARRRSTV